MSFPVSSSDVEEAVSDSVKTEHVKRAYSLFQERIDSLYRPLIQVLTGRPTLKVVADAHKNATDGSKVWLRVPLELGEDTEHIKHLCGARDEETLWMMCPACAVLDEIDSNVFHEACGHIVFNSFVEVSPVVKRKAFNEFLRARVEESHPDKVEMMMDKIMDCKTAMEVANRCDCYLPILTNTVEDIFVNASMYKQRPGTWEPMYASDRMYLTEGSRGLDGVAHKWIDADINQRAITVIYLMANQYDFIHMGADVQKVYDHEGIQAAVARVMDCKTTTDRLALAVEILGYLRDMELCVDHRSFIFKPPPIVIEMTREEYEELKKLMPETDEPEDPDDESQDILIKVTDDPPKPEPKDESDDSEDESGDEPGESSDESDDSKGEAEPGDKSEAGEGEEESDSEPGDKSEAGEGEEESDSEPGDDSSEDSDDGDKGSPAAAGSSTDKAPEPGEAGLGEEGGKADADDNETTDSTPKPMTRPATPEETEEELDRRAEEDRANAEEIKSKVAEFMGHPETEGEEPGEVAHEPESKDEAIKEKLMELYLNQKDFFDNISTTVETVRESKATGTELSKVRLAGTPTDDQLSAAINGLRVAFTLNRKHGIERNLTKGSRLDTRHLYRVPMDDPRLFAKKTIPKKRDWFVTIGLDLSGSTGGGGVVNTIKQGGYAMAEMLQRIGIPFCVYGHSGSYAGGSFGYGLDIYVVKEPHEPWGEEQKKRCVGLTYHQANLDGHTLEYYRRVTLRQRQQDKLIMYFTDGAMPAENYNDELELLKHNILLCDQQRIKLVGVGVGNTEPSDYGLDTIRYDHLGMLPNLVQELALRLEK
jgi:hypothetical protein